MITTTYRKAYLQKKEVNKLKRLIVGYGNFKIISSAFPDIHLNTLRNIVEKGYGSTHNVKAIQDFLHSLKSKSKEIYIESKDFEEAV